MGQSGKKSIQNAVEIIEKFGGIRPMSSKTDIAVTTIQGWKKRGVIPASRKKAILDAAVTHDIDLFELLSDAQPVNDGAQEISVPDSLSDDVPEEAESVLSDESNDDVADGYDRRDEREEKTESQEENAGNVVVADDDQEDDVVEESIIQEPIGLKEEKPKREDEFKASPKALSQRDFTQIAVETERRAVTKGAVLAVAVVLILLVIIGALLWPNFKEFDEHGSRLATLEGSLSDMKETQSSFKGLVSENWSQQLDDLKEQIAQTQQAVGDTVATVQTESRKLLQEKGLEERAIQLQSYVSEIANENGVYGLLSHFDGLRRSLSGRQDLERSVLELSALLTGAEDKDMSDVNAELDAARSQSASLQATLGGVPQEELKAAAMLLTMTQLRSALNRGDEDFTHDLGLLMTMVAEDNIALRESLTKLAPHSRSGVLSFDGLQSEFRTIAGEVVAESLSGEDVSLSEKASARVNDLFQIEKDGELITGTETQATVNKADKMIAGGHLEEALGFLKSSLDAKELAPLKPWIRKAEGVLTSQKVQAHIKQAIELNAGSGFLGGSQLLNHDE